METQQDPEFLNLDLDVESTSDLTDLANSLEGRLFVLYCGENGAGGYRASFEVDPRVELPHNPTSCSEFIVECIESLTPELRALWNGATSRVFDFGYGSGIVPPPYPIKEGRTLNVHRTELSSKLVTLISSLNGSIHITIYPFQPSA